MVNNKCWGFMHQCLKLFECCPAQLWPFFVSLPLVHGLKQGLFIPADCHRLQRDDRWCGAQLPLSHTHTGGNIHNIREMWQLLTVRQKSIFVIICTYVVPKKRVKTYIKNNIVSFLQITQEFHNVNMKIFIYNRGNKKIKCCSL